jgi:hypothetical protein
MSNYHQRIRSLESERANLEIEKLRLDQQLATLDEELEVLKDLDRGKLEVLGDLDRGKQCMHCILTKESSCVPATSGGGCQKCYDINAFCEYWSASKEGSSKGGQR